MITHSKPTLEIEENEAVINCLNSNHILGGPLVSDLENLVARSNNAEGAVCFSSATQAMGLSLKILSEKNIKKVGIPSYVCRSVYDAVKIAGLECEIFDINYSNFSLKFDKVNSDLPDAFIVPHMFGVRADSDEIIKEKKVLIEDCAQRIPPLHILPFEKTPSVRVFSLDATKLITAGEGGIAVSWNKDLVSDLKVIREPNYSNSKFSTKATLTDLQASIGIIQWGKINNFLQRRSKIADFYIKYLQNEGLEKIIHSSMFYKDTYHFRFIVEVDDPLYFIEHAAKKDIAFRRPVAPIGLHQLFSIKGNFDNTNKALQHLLSIPIYPSLKEGEMTSIIETFVNIQKSL